MDAEYIPFEAPEPSDYDLAHLADILAGEGDWFDAMLFRLILKADGANTELLRMAYPFHVRAYEKWRRGES